MTDFEVAKTQLREHLANLLISPVADGFWSIQSAATELCERNKTPDQVLRTFQNMLTKIPEWSDVTLNTEVERIQKVSRCPYLDDLVMGVFISYMKAFASLQQTTSSDISIEFDRPSLSKFVHEIYVHSARKLWQVAYLFKTVGVSAEVQARAHHEVENIINQCLEQVIRSFLPWESIAKKYFSSGSNQSEAPAPSTEVSEDKKTVSFGEDSEEEDEEEDEESEDERPPPLNVSEEDAILDLPEEEQEDPIKELEKKAQETLVLNL